MIVDWSSPWSLLGGPRVVVWGMGGVGGPAPITTPTGPFRDDDAFIGKDGLADPATSIVGLLEATGEFDEGGVIFASGPDRARDTSQMGRVATITPDARGRMIAQPDPYRKRREMGYTLTLKVREEETTEGESEADRLSSVVHNTLQNVSYGGFCLFERSVISEDTYDDSRHPEVRVTMRGMFSYMIDFSSTKMRVTS
jgi:hypothetical protein